MVSRLKEIFIVLAVAAAFISCALPNMPVFLDDETVEAATTNGVDFEEISRTDNVVVLLWDAPSTPVYSYNVYYREHETQEWNLLATVPATEFPEYAVTAVDLKGKLLDFAVTSIDAYGNESGIHSSLDQDADPPTGWYLHWAPP